MWAWVARKREAVLALFAAGVLVLSLLAVFAVELSNTQAKSKRDVEARVHERAVLAAALIDSLFQSVDHQLPQYAATYGARKVNSAQLDRKRQQALYVVLLDSHEHVLAASAGFNPQARADLARSAALAQIRLGHPYGIGNVLSYGHTGVINFAVRIPTRYGTRILLSGFRPSDYSAFVSGELRKIPGVKGAHSYLVDGNNTVVASNNPAWPAGHRFDQPAQRQALGRRTGDAKGHYYDQVNLSNSTMRILLTAPNGALFASVTGLRKWVPWLIFAAFGVFAILALALGRRVLRSAGQVREANGRLEHDAMHDGLTGLPNRALFMDRVDQAIHRARSDTSTGGAVLFLDIDRFKLVNDSLSHAVGDQLLIALAERVSATLRPCDTVARIGGDEFTLLLEGVTTEADAAIIADRVRAALGQSFSVNGHQLFLTVSIGITVSSPTMSAADLVRNADIAMYDAKRRGRAGWAAFDESMRRRVVRRLERENELRKAIERSLLEVHYQPIVDLATGRLRAFEALARWPSGWPAVAPIEFIPIAEETGLIGLLGSHVMQRSLQALSVWRRRGLVAEDVCMSVNVSGLQLEDPTLPSQVRSALAGAGLPAQALRLEITESTLMQEHKVIAETIAEVCDSGVGLHLDDFGTGYSSLATLHRCPVGALKIDRSFAASLKDDAPENDVIIRSTIALAHSFGLYVIAEGIEDLAQLRRLRTLGCEYGQGFLFSPPLSEEAAPALLSSWSPSAVSRLADRLEIE